MPEQPPLTEEQQKALQEKLKNMSPEQLLQLQKQQCIFCQIVAGKVPSKKLYEDEQSIAILDINPVAKGHLLLLPKEHYAIMPQVPDPQLGALVALAKKLSKVLLRTLKVSGTTLYVANGLAAGQRAQHFMIHLIPRREGDGLLNAEEKVLESDKRDAVFAALGNTLNEIMGNKKTIVPAGEKAPPRKRPVKKDPVPSPQDEKKPSEEEKHSDNGKPSGDGASLDDIARLFA